MGGETTRNALGIQDHQTCPDRRYLILTGIWNGSDHPGRHLHTDTSSGRGGPRPEWRFASPDARSLKGKVTTGPKSTSRPINSKSGPHTTRRWSLENSKSETWSWSAWFKVRDRGVGSINKANKHWRGWTMFIKILTRNINYLRELKYIE